MTAPSMIWATSLGTPCVMSVFCSSLSITAPTTAPQTVTLPPVRGVPATATAAIASSSMPTPVLLASEAEVALTVIRPTSPASTAAVTYARSLTRAAGRPASREAVSLPPTAST